MTGKYNIEVYNNRVHYFLTVKRNITILQGNSATGKTELLRLISDHETNGVSSGITLLCDKRCTVLTPVDWELRLSGLESSIVFIDETAGFIKSKRFAELVKGSDNYFVIVTRDDLSQLPYSIEEIYGLKNVSDNQKYKSYRRIYNEMYKLYDFNISKEFEPDTVLTEDSNSGYEFFKLLYGEKCISAKGKSNVYQCIRDNSNKQILAIVDGAAFGAEIGKIYRYLESNYVKSVIYAPESFEFLLLSAGFVDVPYDVTAETWKYADSKLYMSWEEFYTDHLIKNTSGTVYQYNKNRLAAPYKTEGIISKVVSVMPDEILLK
ncbi:MAG: translation initiation factor 2 [Oscillospiraceae bacterium]|nr:translation initiation factor 2 [Oscillospiraceae bacterium]